MRRNIKAVIDDFADYVQTGRPSVDTVTVKVTEPYLRRRLGLRKKDPLEYRGLRIAVRATPSGGPGHE